MAIDTTQLRKIATDGDQTKKIAVTRAWLKAVADEIDALRKNQIPPRSKKDEADDIMKKLFGGKW